MTDARREELRTPHKGMPPLDESGPAVSFFEFWPQKLFYPPLFFYWVWLTLRHGGFTLPTISNPRFPFGGWIGESKSRVFENAGQFARQYIASWLQVRRSADLKAEDALRQANLAGLNLPFIAKPDLGCRGVGVRRIRNVEELQAYIERFPMNEDIVLQSLVDHEAEAGIFYVRKPSEKHGRIISVTLKYFPYVYGDGKSTLRELIERDRRAGPLAHIYMPRHATRLHWIVPDRHPFRLAYAGSHSRGTIFRNGNRFVTQAMTDAFDRIAKDIDEFYFGRFDIRFTSIEDLQVGRGFTIVEVNGAGAEATHIWDRNTTLLEAYGALMQQYRLLWETGAENARRGFRPASLPDLIRAYRHEVRLWAQYPLTE